LEFWAANLPAMAGVAKPMWSLTGQQLLYHFQNGLPGVEACLSTDASMKAWGAVLEFLKGKVVLHLQTARQSSPLRSGWVQGDEMVRTGVDHLSREGAVDKHEVAVSEEAWQLAQTLATQHGLHLNVDMFASPNTARLPRFWSRLHSHGCEGADALSAQSWAQYPCDQCTAVHDQGVFLFPPPPLASMVVDKAKRDGARGVLVIPYRPDSKWWSVLEQACPPGGIIALDHAPVNLALADASYARVNWRLCCFNFNPDARFVPAQCPPSTRWTRPTPSPSELQHKRHLLALLAAAEKTV